VWLSSTADDERLAEAALLATSLAVVALLAALVWRLAAAIPVAIALLASPYVAVLAFEAEGLDTAAPALAGALYLVAELAYWSLELRGPGYEERRVVARRLGALGVLAFLSVLLGAFVVVLTAAPLGGGLAWDAVGVAAAAGTLAIVAWLARRAA
jgi:hypothetical protein